MSVCQQNVLTLVYCCCRCKLFVGLSVCLCVSMGLALRELQRAVAMVVCGRGLKAVCHDHHMQGRHFCDDVQLSR